MYVQIHCCLETKVVPKNKTKQKSAQIGGISHLVVILTTDVSVAIATPISQYPVARQKSYEIEPSLSLLQGSCSKFTLASYPETSLLRSSQVATLT